MINLRELQTLTIVGIYLIVASVAGIIYRFMEVTTGINDEDYPREPTGLIEIIVHNVPTRAYLPGTATVNKSNNADVTGW